ncbi:MAG: hypothetical protein WC027_02790 [Candidatus Paceibacterota bacterium]
MLKVIDWVLQHCGSSLAKALNSKRFAQLLKREEQILATKSDSYEAIALRTGHLMMGSLLNRMPERQAIAEALAMNGCSQPSAEERALIHLCGEKIISAARKCLPDSIVQMAKRWKTVDADEQLAIVRELYFELRSESQEAKGTLTMKVIEDGRDDEEHHQLMSDRGFIPGLYGKWNKETNLANCQGKTQMLLAFAKLAGAKAMVVHPITQIKDIETLERRNFKQCVVRDLTDRGLINGSSEFSESLRAGYYDDKIRDQRSQCFHVGVVLQLQDGRWVMVDPHGLSWGLLSDEWNIPGIRPILQKYQTVLPGLALVAKDETTGKAILKEIAAKAMDLLHRSRVMEEKIKAKVKTLADLIDVLYESEDFDLLMQMNWKQEGHEPLDLSNQQIRKYAVMLSIMGEEDMFNFGAMFDPNFLQKKIGIWLTFYHCVAMNLFLNRESDDGKMVHPVCEVSVSADWAVAISAINSATWHCESEDRKSQAEFFVRNSFDQVTLYNAASLARTPVGTAAYEALRSLKYLHQLCLRKIQIVERGWF